MYIYIYIYICIYKAEARAAIDAEETPLLRDRERREGREAGAEAGKEALQAGPVDRRGGAGNLL